jgi:hypothetical protein
MTRSHVGKTNAATIMKEVHSLLDPNLTETSLSNLRQRILQLYKVGHLTGELATAQLLRIDIDEIVRARKFDRQTDSFAVPATG